MTSSSYRALLERLFALTRFGEKLDLSTPRALDAALGHPLQEIRSILVGGTNGKGSCCAALEALLRSTGARVGLFTSPHLISFRERIRIDGEPISERALLAAAEVAEAKIAAAQLQPSFFEMTWAIAAEAFRQAGVPWVIWEVGLGGRLDATNVCEPVLSLITNVGLDHVAVLGGSLTSIAREKSALFRRGRPALTAATGAGREALLDACGDAKVELSLVELPSPPLRLSLLGEHQQRNCALALEGLRALGLEPEPAALAGLVHPGRLEYLSGLWLDCAHNPPGGEALARWLAAQPPMPTRVLFGATRDKDWAGTLTPLLPLIDELWWVSPDSPRALSAEELSSAAASALALPAALTQQTHPSVSRALNTVQRLGQAEPSRSRTLVTGSCYLVGEARAHLTGSPYPEHGLRTTAR